jgi:hypothetical protein
MLGTNMIKPNLKRALSGLALLLLVVIHPAKANSDTADALESIYQMQTIAFSILGDYYMFSGLEGDSRYSREMYTQIKQFENLIGKLTSTGSPATKIDSFGPALIHWQEYKKLIETNRTDFITQGYASARLVDDLGSKVIDLNKSLQKTYDTMILKNKFILSKQTQDTRKMGLIIQTITVEYAARSTANLVMKLDINEGGMVGQAKVFDKLLNNLKESTKSDKYIFKLTDQIGVKWSFINKSVANYNENAVPFIVNTYGDRITQNLQSVGKHFSSQVQAKK